MNARIYLKFLIALLLFSVFTQGKCKKSSSNNPENWTRTFELRLTFSQYLRNTNTGDPRCDIINTAYCANSASDLMGCRTCHWALPGLQNRNLFTKSLSTDSWYGTISIYNADNGTSIGSVNLGDPNQKNVKCNVFGSFEGKIPDGNIKIVVKLFEPCFHTGYCRGTIGGKYPRSIWYWEGNVNSSAEHVKLDLEINESAIETIGLC